MIVEGSSSDIVPVVSGVPPGSVLGPMLFLLFISDLPDKITSNSRLFADDCIVYRQIKGISDCEALQEDLNMLAEWETKWGMAFHPQKCSVLSVTRSRTPTRFNFHQKATSKGYKTAQNTLVWTCSRHYHRKTTSTGSPRRPTVCWGSCDAI